MATAREQMGEQAFKDPAMAHVGGFEALEREYSYEVPNDEVDGPGPWIRSP